jgi:hypothetical protein
MTGNRIWRVETPSGPAVQKLYGERSGSLRSLGKTAVERLLRRKSTSSARSRYATERHLLALWAEAQIDVPADVGSRHPEFLRDDVLLLEFVDGRPMLIVLAEKRLAQPEREDLLRRFAAGWSRRHRLAVETGEAGFVQEHGTFQHVLVAGDRLVSIDLEQAFRRTRDTMPLVSKEIAAYLRSLWGGVDAETFRRDVESLVEGYESREFLAAAANEYLHNRSRIRRWMWALDRIRNARRGRGKYVALQVLDEILRERYPDVFSRSPAGLQGGIAPPAARRAHSPAARG